MRVILGSSLLVLFGFAAQAFAVEPGQPIPNFSLPALKTDNPSIITLSDYRGTVVYLDFWDSWCAPCRESLPKLSALNEQYPDLKVVAVNLDTDPRDGLRFLARYRLSYPVASDPSPRSADVYRLKGLPTAFLIDRDGIVRHVFEGFDKNDLPRIHRLVARLVADSKTT